MRAQSVGGKLQGGTGGHLVGYKELTAPIFAAWLETHGDTVALRQVELVKSLHAADQRVNELALESGQSREVIVGKSSPWESLMKQSTAELQRPYQQFQQET